MNLQRLRILESLEKTGLRYGDTLNPALWDSVDGQYVLHQDVEDHLLMVARNFIDALGVHPDSLIDIIFTGSNCNFNWSEFSDIDLHFAIDYGDSCDRGGLCALDLDDCLQAKKTLWNDRHNVTIHGFPVEVYAHDSEQQFVGSAAAYSLMHGDWLVSPSFDAAVQFDEAQIIQKANDLASQIDQLISSETNDPDEFSALNDKLRQYRQAGLSTGGEFSLENLVFKTLRNNGYVEKLRGHITTAQDSNLSLP